MIDITTFILTKNYVIQKVNKQAGQEVSATISSATGKINKEDLEKLLNSHASTVVIEQKIYRLARIEGTLYKYINTITNDNKKVISMTELDLNTKTGDFTIKALIVDQTPVEELREEFEAHRDNADIHITADERAFWNNKVTADVEQLDGGSSFQLNLHKD